MNKPEEYAPARPRLAAIVAADGSGTSAYLSSLTHPAAPARDLTDAAHFICVLHGRHPGIMGQALARVSPAPEWVAVAGRTFPEERSFLARIVAAAGPLPSTPGHAEAEATVAAQRHAIEMLACSDRVGCALGAAGALVLDWLSIRAVLDAAAARFGLPSPPLALPVAATAQASFGDHERAVLFAGQQLLAQHRGLWQLLEARAAARSG